MNPSDAAALRRSVEDAIVGAGIDAVGTTSVEPFTDARRALDDRRRRGQHAGMSFTFRNPARSTEPARLLRHARAMVVGALGYLEPVPERPAGPVARVARYAWRDHYAELRRGLGAGAAVLRDAGHRAVVIADDNGLVDRAAAHRAGLGWWGRNSNLLVPGAGSWFVLGSVVTDAPLPVDAEPVADGCRSCTRCIEACPTGAIVGDGVIDARRCLAWLLQDAGVFPRAHRVALGDRLYGCDDCQDACPPSSRTLRSSAAGPRGSVADQRTAPVADVPVRIGRSGPPEAWVPVLDVLDATDEELIDRHGRWYIPKRDPRYLRRNALVVLGNVGDGDEPRQRVVLDRYLAHPDPMLRAHAVWAAARLGLHDRVGRASTDPDPLVRAEAAMAPGVAPAPGATRAAAVRG